MIFSFINFVSLLFTLLSFILQEFIYIYIYELEFRILFLLLRQKKIVMNLGNCVNAGKGPLVRAV